MFWCYNFYCLDTMTDAFWTNCFCKLMHIYFSLLDYFKIFHTHIHFFLFFSLNSYLSILPQNSEWKLIHFRSDAFWWIYCKNLQREMYICYFKFLNNAELTAEVYLEKVLSFYWEHNSFKTHIPQHTLNLICLNNFH